MARLFFAFWPDDAARERLAQLARDVCMVAQAKPVDPAKLHLTLAFLGDVGEERVAALRAAGEGLRGSRFGLSLDRVGSFRRARVAWAGMQAVPARLVELQSALELALRADGFVLEERPFRPHVTLTRKAKSAVPLAAIPPIAYPCDAVALVRSDLGKGTYTTLESWPLA